MICMFAGVGGGRQKASDNAKLQQLEADNAALQQQVRQLTGVSQNNFLL